MTDVIVGRIKGEVLFVRDADDDGVFDEGERIGVRGPGDRFEESRVQDALGRAAIAGFRTGARLQRIGTYIDYINEAERNDARNGDHSAGPSRGPYSAFGFATDRGRAGERGRHDFPRGRPRALPGLGQRRVLGGCVSHHRL